MSVSKIKRTVFKIIKFSIKNSIRIAFMLVSILFLLGISAWLTTVHYINANNIGEQIAKQLGVYFGRSILISRVEFRLPSTFILEDLKIVDNLAPDYRELVSIKTVALHFEIMPLLENKVFIKEAVFENPVINITKTPEGKFNLPELKNTARSSKGTEFAFTTKEGAAWKVLIQDWVLKNGTFTFRNFASKQSHSLNGFNLRFYDLDFNEPSRFDLNFVLRNKIKNKIIEAETSAKGIINFANFKLPEMVLQDTDIDINALKSPLKINLNINNFVDPGFKLNVKLPHVTENDFDFLFNTKENYSLPYTELSLEAAAKDNFNQIDIASLNLKNKDITLAAKSNLNLSSGTLIGDLSVTKAKIDASKIAAYYKPLKPFALVGNLDAGGKFVFEDSVFKTKKLNLKSESISSKIFNFTVQNANIAFEASNNFNQMSATVEDGIFLVGRQKVASIKGRTALDYPKQDFFAIIEKGNLNEKQQMKMSVAIANVRQEKKRKVKMLLALEELKPLEIFDIVEDFAQALAPDHKSDWKEDTSDLAWLRNFRAALPSFMKNFKGAVYAKKFTSPILSGEDFYSKFNFTGLLPQMKTLGGSFDATLSNGIIYKLQEAADNQKVLGIAYQPFVIMNRMERAGSFKMGKILKDTPFDIMSGSVSFKNGSMDVNNFYVDGPVISAAISGYVDWVKEKFDLNIVTMFKNTSKRGALSENLTDESGDPALAFVTYGPMSKPKLEMKSPKKVGKQIQAAREKENLEFGEIKKFKE